MELTLDAATDLSRRVLTRYGMPPVYAEMVAEHLVDAALSGHEFSSLARLPTLAKLLKDRPPAGDIKVVHETVNSALIDGGGNLAYATSVIAIDKAIEICRKTGIAVVSVNNTWFSGRLAYYVERAARAGFVAMHAIQGAARTAPFGGMESLFGTCPVAFAFPSDDEPVLIDMSMSATTHGGANLAKAKGELLPEGLALDSNGYPTVDPEAALNGAFLTWGGHRGSGIALAVHLLGMLAGTAPVIKSDSDFGLFFLLIDPELLIPGGQYRTRVTELKQIFRAIRPAPGVERVRLPGEKSQAHRKHAAEAGAAARVQVDDKIYARILDLLD